MKVNYAVSNFQDTQMLREIALYYQREDIKTNTMDWTWEIYADTILVGKSLGKCPPPRDREYTRMTVRSNVGNRDERMVGGRCCTR
jgi:hypothetical protein